MGDTPSEQWQKVARERAEERRKRSRRGVFVIFCGCIGGLVVLVVIACIVGAITGGSERHAPAAAKHPTSTTVSAPATTHPQKGWTAAEEKGFLSTGTGGRCGLAVLERHFPTYVQFNDVSNHSNGPEYQAAVADLRASCPLPPPPPPPPNPPTMSLAEFNQIQTGDDDEQVVGIVGGPGSQTVHTEIAGITGDIYMWDGEGGLGANANVQFQNGKVIGKSQFGLR